MSKPKRQHFIPRSYLNNFSESKGKKYFIGASRKGESTKINKFSTKDICVQKNLYTIPSNDETKKYALEHFYGERVDSVYPEVYRILVDENTTLIDFNTRLKIMAVYQM